MIKNLSVMQETWVQSLGWEDRDWATSTFSLSVKELDCRLLSPSSSLPCPLSRKKWDNPSNNWACNQAKGAQIERKFCFNQNIQLSDTIPGLTQSQWDTQPIPASWKVDLELIYFKNGLDFQWVLKVIVEIPRSTSWGGWGEVVWGMLKNLEIESLLPGCFYLPSFSAD